MKTKLIEVFPDKCTGCRLCEMACSLHREQTCSSVLSRIRILKYEEFAVDVPQVCVQCPEAHCLEACAMGAFRKNEETGVVELDKEACNGCEACVAACPVGGLALDPRNQVVFKCDLCGGDPECVKWCTRDAITVREVDAEADRQRSATIYADKMKQLLQAPKLAG